MATSLASQLQKLAAPQTSILVESKKRSSLLFEPSEAAKYGRDIFFEIGQSGFQDLVEVNSEFEKFREKLFGQTAKDFQRTVQSKDVNKELDQTIEKFLLLLSPYLEKQASLKALEWMVYRFMINSLNRKSLLMCIFPYYESALFIRVLQILDVSRETDEWYWLHGSQKSGRPVPKQTVFTRWIHNQSFRAFVSSFLKKMLKVHKNEGNLRTAISFFVTTVIGGITLVQTVKEEHLLYIVSVLEMCLLSPHNELVAGMYLIIALVGVKARLTEEIVQKIISFMIQDNSPPASLIDQCVLCLVSLSHHQKIDSLLPETVGTVMKKSLLLKKLGKLSKTKSVASFLSAYVMGFFRWLLSGDSDGNELKVQQKLTKLIQQLERLPLSSSDSSQVIWCVFESLKQNMDYLKKNKSWNSLGTVISRLEVSHPEGFSLAVSRLLKSGGDYKLVLSDVITAEAGSETSFLQILHPDDNIRLSAVENFVEKLSKGHIKDTNVISSQMKIMLTDEHPAIVLKAITMKKGLKVLDEAFVLSHCKQMLSESKSKGNEWDKVTMACLSILCNDLSDTYDQDALMDVLYICLPYVLYPRLTSVSGAKTIFKSKLTSRISILSALSLEMSPILGEMKKSSKDYARKIWQILPRVLSDMSSEDQTLMWNNVGNILGSQQPLMSHFVSLLLLFCGLQHSDMDQRLQLKLAHQTIDACLVGLDNYKASVSDKSDVEEEMRPKDLSSYLNAVVEGSLPVTFLMSCIERSLTVFSLPPECKASPYWSLQKEDPAEGGSLLLLVKALKASVQLERFGDKGIHFRNKILAYILKTCLGSREQWYYLLSIVWGWQSSMHYSDIIDETLQVWCLGLGSSLLASHSTSLSWALSVSQPLVPALISAITCGNDMVRLGAMNCIKILAAVIGARLNQDNHSFLLELIVEQAEEVIADESHITSCLANPKGKSSFKKTVQGLLQVVTTDEVPIHIKTPILYILSSKPELDVLQKLLTLADGILDQISSLKEHHKLDSQSSLSLYYILLCFTPDTADILDTENGWKVFHKAISSSSLVLDIHKDITSSQTILIDQVMSQRFFASIKSEELQAQLWSILISRVVESEDPGEATQLRKGLRKVTLDSAVIIKQIEALELSSRVTSIKAAQAKRIKQRGEAYKSTELLNWKKLGLMLETIGVMASLGRPWLLVGPLCQCLQRTFTLDSAMTDLLQQQLLSALLHLLELSMKEQGKETSRGIPLNVEMIVQCIRSSLSPDTHRRAMLILALAAKIFPDVVMHNMMTIFTFMGTSLLRRDDSYSFQVIHQTIQSIVPTLIESELSKGSLVGKLAQVCQVFVDAFPDLPEHRRLPLFKQLATTIDVDKHLWVLLALMADSHVTREIAHEAAGGKEEDRRRRPKVIEFGLLLSSQFSVCVQVSACFQLMKYLNDLPEEKETTTTTQQPQAKSKMEVDIISWNSHSPKQFCHFKYTSAGLLAHLLTSETFVRQLSESPENLKGQLSQLYQKLLESTLCYLRSVSDSCDKHKDKPAGRIWTSIQRRVVDVLDGINAILPVDMLLEVMSGLLVAPLPLVRCKAIEMLCSKLQPSANFFSEEHTSHLLTFIAILRAAGLSSEEPIENRQVAIYCLQLLTRQVAPQVQPSSILPIMSGGVRLVSEEGTPVKIVTQALLMVADCVAALKAHSVQFLAQLVPVVLKLSLLEEEGDHLVLACVTAMHKLVENVPQLLSPHLVSLLCSICRLSAKTGEAGKESRLRARLSAVRDTLPEQVEPRVLIPNLSQAYQALSEEDLPALQTLMMMVEKLITHVPPKALRDFIPALLKLFTEALDLRTVKGDSEAVIAIEDSVCSALTKLLLRLNEHDNISIFSSLQNWAVEATDTSPSRLISFYRFADYVAGTLKVLFIKAKLADSLFTNAAAVLERNNFQHNASSIFGSGEEAERKTRVLIQSVLDTLSKIFMYDSVKFTNVDRFQLIGKPLTDQLENTFQNPDDYRSHVSNHLVPCITKFVIAVGDDSLWKTTNRQILLRFRNDDNPVVILGALEAFEGLIDALGEDYLQPLLADTMPYITEVLETVDTEVQETVKNIFTKMESILGDNLRAYLDN